MKKLFLLTLPLLCGTLACGEGASYDAEERWNGVDDPAAVISEAPKSQAFAVELQERFGGADDELDEPNDDLDEPDRWNDELDGPGGADELEANALVLKSNGATTAIRGSIMINSIGGTCSAVILNNTTFITAAHCVDEGWRTGGGHSKSFTANYKSGNSTVASWNFTCTTTSCPFVYIHPNHVGSSSTSVNPRWDVAIVKLKGTHTFGYSAGVGERNFVPIYAARLSKRKQGWTSGYGRNSATGPTGTHRNIKQRVVYRDNTHYYKWSHVNSNESIFAGDSGGPTLRDSGLTDNQGKYWGPNVSVTSSANSTSTWATRLADKMDWIESIVTWQSNYKCGSWTTPNGDSTRWCWDT